MSEPTIICPNCSTEIRLTESLAAPLIAATRQQFEARLRQKDEDVAKKESAMKAREAAIEAERQALDNEVAKRLKAERTKIAEDEAKKARALLQSDLEQNAQQVKELKEVLAERDKKLAEAQQAQAALLRKERELEDAKREMALNVEKQVQAGLAAARDKARKDADEELGLKVREKEQTIASMQKQIEELKRKAEQGSQQLQGEVQELVLEELLKAKFPLDDIVPVPKGEFGGDVTQAVRGAAGQACGLILWESKRTKNWSDAWLPKLRDDQRTVKADLAIMVSQVLPKGVEIFDHVDNVWVIHPTLVLPVAMMLRQGLIEVALARQSSEGLHTKTELLYQYLTGPRFRQRLEAIAESFTTMKEDLDRERKVIMKQWAKRDAQIERVTQATIGMYGDLQGIAGKTLQEIEGLELKALEDDATTAIEGETDEGKG
ncbi:MAG: DUF2130 domain-containing protein [Gammaproteobacteria bacterium]|nr:DUF2130 domain-containing protein [Gammaproteobacteria bacterium]